MKAIEARLDLTPKTITLPTWMADELERFRLQKTDVECKHEAPCICTAILQARPDSPRW